MVEKSLLNKSSTEKTLLKSGEILPVMEAFDTLQGEGFYTGNAAYFIRLGGCDVGCHWCDVKESWDASNYPLIQINDIVEKANDSNADLAVVTGGEPGMYNLGPLTSQLQKKGFKTCIETSGAYPLTGFWHWVCLSPKKMKEPLENVYQKADELKVIIYNKDDFSWAEKNAAKVNENCKLYLQPEWSKREKVMPLITEFVKKNPDWQVSLQTHKYLNIP